MLIVCAVRRQNRAPQSTLDSYKVVEMNLKAAGCGTALNQRKASILSTVTIV
jgi:hypothetical protein